MMGFLMKGNYMCDKWLDRVQNKDFIFGRDTSNKETKDADIYFHCVGKQLNNALIYAYMQTFKCNKRVAKIKLKRNNMI